MTTTKSTQAVETAELTPLQIVDAGIKQVVADHDINIQKNRYKAMRAIAWQAFVESIEAGEFDALVDRASANVDELPSGWELEAASKSDAKPTQAKAPVTKAPAKKAPARRAPVKKATA